MDEESILEARIDLQEQKIDHLDTQMRNLTESVYSMGETLKIALEQMMVNYKRHQRSHKNPEVVANQESLLALDRKIKLLLDENKAQQGSTNLMGEEENSSSKIGWRNRDVIREPEFLIEPEISTQLVKEAGPTRSIELGNPKQSTMVSKQNSQPDYLSHQPIIKPKLPSNLCTRNFSDVLIPRWLNPKTHLIMIYFESQVFGCAHKVLDESPKPDLVGQLALTILYADRGCKLPKPLDDTCSFMMVKPPACVTFHIAWHGLCGHRSKPPKPVRILLSYYSSSCLRRRIAALVVLICGRQILKYLQPPVNKQYVDLKEGRRIHIQDRKALQLMLINERSLGKFTSGFHIVVPTAKVDQVAKFILEQLYDLTYRFQGLNGEATDSMIKQLDDTKESQDPEVEFKIAGAVLNLLMSCCRKRENRRALLRIGALSSLLEIAHHAFSVDAIELAEGILLIVVSLTIEANNYNEGAGAKVKRNIHEHNFATKQTGLVSNQTSEWTSPVRFNYSLERGFPHALKGKFYNRHMKIGEEELREQWGSHKAENAVRELWIIPWQQCTNKDDTRTIFQVDCQISGLRTSLLYGGGIDREYDIGLVLLNQQPNGPGLFT